MADGDGEWTVRALTAATWEDFAALHANGECQGCYCSYWQYEGTDRTYQLTTPDERRAEKHARVEAGRTHGMIAYAPDGRAVGSVQVEPRNTLGKLTRRMPYQGLDDEGVWCVTCFMVLEASRRHGVARALLRGAVAWLAAEGEARVVEAIPRRGEGLGDAEHLTGPEGLFASEGFTCVREHVQYPVWRRVSSNT